MSIKWKLHRRRRRLLWMQSRRQRRNQLPLLIRKSHSLLRADRLRELMTLAAKKRHLAVLTNNPTAMRGRRAGLLSGKKFRRRRAMPETISANQAMVLPIMTGLVMLPTNRLSASPILVDQATRASRPQPLLLWQHQNRREQFLTTRSTRVMTNCYRLLPEVSPRRRRQLDLKISRKMEMRVFLELIIPRRVALSRRRRHLLLHRRVFLRELRNGRIPLHQHLP